MSEKSFATPNEVVDMQLTLKKQNEHIKELEDALLQKAHNEIVVMDNSEAQQKIKSWKKKTNGSHSSKLTHSTQIHH